MLAEIREATGYSVTYLSTLLRSLARAPQQAAVVGRGGRPKASGRALTKAQEERVRDWICQSYPDQLQLPSALWTRKAIQRLIKDQCRVLMSVHSVGNYLKRWGYVPKPIPLGHERDKARVLVLGLLTESYLRFRRRARKERAEIYWGELTNIRSDESRHQRSASRGMHSATGIPRRHKRKSLVSAITHQGGIRFMMYSGAMSDVVLIEFMRRLVKDAGRKVFLILGNLAVHNTQEVSDWLWSREDHIEVFVLQW
ncbi:MAG: transposase [Rhodanobacteraceae bacterium]